MTDIEKACRTCRYRCDVLEDCLCMVNGIECLYGKEKGEDRDTSNGFKYLHWESKYDEFITEKELEL